MLCYEVCDGDLGPHVSIKLSHFLDQCSLFAFSASLVHRLFTYLRCLHFQILTDYHVFEVRSVSFLPADGINDHVYLQHSNKRLLLTHQGYNVHVNMIIQNQYNVPQAKTSTENH